MHQNNIPLGSPGPVKILQQFSMVRMAGKGIHLPYSGPDRILFTQDGNLFPPIHNLAAKCMFRTIAYKKNRIFRIADVIRQVVKNAPCFTHS